MKRLVVCDRLVVMVIVEGILSKFLFIWEKKGNREIGKN